MANYLNVLDMTWGMKDCNRNLTEERWSQGISRLTKKIENFCDTQIIHNEQGAVNNMHISQIRYNCSTVSSPGENSQSWMNQIDMNEFSVHKITADQVDNGYAKKKNTVQNKQCTE
jgi:hypothetical protein